jgi:hypothetical protein
MAGAMHNKSVAPSFIQRGSLSQLTLDIKYNVIYQLCGSRTDRTMESKFGKAIHAAAVFAGRTDGAPRGAQAARAAGYRPCEGTQPIQSRTPRTDLFYMITRRRFLRDSTLFAAATLASGRALAKPVRSRANPLGQFQALATQPRFGAFAANLGTAFWVRQDQGPAAGLELARVKAFPPPANAVQAAAPDAWNEKFSLQFRGLAGQPLGQDTYLFEHATLGSFYMFIVPAGADAEGILYYLAIFNRPAGP